MSCVPILRADFESGSLTYNLIVGTICVFTAF